MNRSLFACFTLLFSAGLIAGTASATMFWQEWKSGIQWPVPEVINPGGPETPPSDAIVLFDGKDLSAFKGGEKWTITDEGYAIVNGGGLTSKQSFGDMQLHLEFASPPEVESSGQGRGNSGVYLMGEYEVQILDSYENETYIDGQCGSIYKQAPPIVNACRPPGEWQAYDILFTAPKFADDGELLSPAYITVLHNGVVIHNHYELKGRTSYTAPPSYKKHGEKRPFSLQNHGDKVRFRNIWVRENVHNAVGKLPEEQQSEEEKAADKDDSPKSDDKSAQKQKSAKSNDQKNNDSADEATDQE